MKEKVICGIQQVGIGVNDFVEAWKWYYDNFGFEIKIVDDEGVAERMLPYTGGKPQPRRSGIAVNIRGGGGFEIWQPKGRELNYLKEPVKLGDLGILIAKVKAPNIETAYNTFINKGLDVEKCGAIAVRAIKRQKHRKLIGRTELLMAHIHKYCLPLYYKLSRKISAT